jgi:hypothetical protein
VRVPNDLPDAAALKAEIKAARERSTFRFVSEYGDRDMARAQDQEADRTRGLAAAKGSLVMHKIARNPPRGHKKMTARERGRAIER